MSLKVDIVFTLNGAAERASVSTDASALVVLREQFDLAGAKLACGEGECGACTIIVDGLSLNGCLMPAVDLDGRRVETVEGLWRGPGLDPVQRSFVETGAIQCGYCTPGMVMQARHLIERNPGASEADIRRGLEGNICRCTGYRKIVDAVVSALRAARP